MKTRRYRKKSSKILTGCEKKYFKRPAELPSCWGKNRVAEHSSSPACGHSSMLKLHLLTVPTQNATYQESYKDEGNKYREGRNGLRNICRQLPISQDDWCLPVLCPTTCLTLEVTIPRHSSIFLWFHSLALQWRSIIAVVLAVCRSLGPCHVNPCVAIKRTQQLNRRHGKEQSLSNISAPQTQSTFKAQSGPKADTLGCFSLELNVCK